MSQPNTIITEITAHLQSQLDCEAIEVIDETALHTGHASYTPGKYHIRIIIESASLRALPRIQSHRIIYSAIAAWMPSVLHAVAIECR